MKQRPSVSVIIPTYNRARMVGRAIRSVLAQTFQDWELIVVDDGSTDNTQEVVEGFGNGRIRYLRQEQNRGCSAARNTGAKAAQGQCIGFLDSDDEWLPSKLERQLSKLAETGNGVGVVLCGFAQVHQATGKTLSVAIHRVQGRLPPGYNMGTGSVPLMRKQCFDTVGGYDEGLPTHTDTDLTLRLSPVCQFASVEEVLVKVYKHGEQISADLQARMEGYSLRKAKESQGADTAQAHSRVQGNLKAELGKLHCLTGNRRQGRRYLWDALLASPRNWRLCGHLVLSLCPHGVYVSVVSLWARLRGVPRFE